MLCSEGQRDGGSRVCPGTVQTAGLAPDPVGPGPGSRMGSRGSQREGPGPAVSQVSGRWTVARGRGHPRTRPGSLKERPSRAGGRRERTPRLPARTQLRPSQLSAPGTMRGPSVTLWLLLALRSGEALGSRNGSGVGGLGNLSHPHPVPTPESGKECGLLVWGSGHRRGRESWGELGCPGYPEGFLEEASSGKAECEMLRDRVGPAWEEKVGGPGVARVGRSFGGLGLG